MGEIDFKGRNYLDSLNPQNVNSDLKQMLNVALRLYATESGSRSRVKIQWIDVVCREQTEITECGYYVMKFMKTIVEDGIEVLNNKGVWRKDTYTNEEIDLVREEWVDYVTNFMFV